MIVSAGWSTKGRETLVKKKGGRGGEKERTKEKIESERDSGGCHILYEL